MAKFSFALPFKRNTFSNFISTLLQSVIFQKIIFYKIISAKFDLVRDSTQGYLNSQQMGLSLVK